MSLPQRDAAEGPGATFLQHLTLIDRVVAIIARRHGMEPADAADFAAWAKAHLIDGDYAAIRKFGGRSSFGTWLTVVLTNLFRDFRNQRWGRWRPSAAARRLGPDALRLESLVYRDGHPVHEAIEILRSRGTGATPSELNRLFTQVPPRAAAREVPLEAADRMAAAPGADEPFLESEREREEHEAKEVLLRAIQGLSAEDQVILRLRYWENLSVADTARTLRLDQKPLYRRLEALQGRLREALELQGIDQARVSSLLGQKAGA